MIEFSNVGQGIRQASACGERIVSAFIQAPVSMTHVSCAEAVPPVEVRRPSPE
jgi:hypothetical protein